MNSMDCSSVSCLEGDEADGIVGAGGAHVGELLLADAVDVEIVVAGVLADDHAFVDLDAVAEEEDAAVLDAVQRVGVVVPWRSEMSAPVGRCGISPV